MDTNKRREHYLDIAKGIGIILVVYGHLLRRQTQFEKIADYSIYIYSFHMALFFFVSGMCLFLKFKDMTLNEINIKYECFRIIKRFLVPYAVWSILYIFFSKSVSETFITKLKYVLTFHGIAPVWFLGTLFFCELLFILLYKLLRKNNIVILLAIFINVACTFAMAFVRINLNLEILKNSETLNYLSISLGRLFACNSILLLGYLFAKLKIITYLKRIPCLILGILCLAILMIICYKTKNEIVLQFFKLGNYSFAKSTIIYFICSVLGSIGIVFISYAISKCRFLEYLGRQSLGIMMLHYVPLPTMMYSVEFVSIFTGNMYFCLIASGIITIALSLFGLFLCKKKLYLSE